MSFSAIIDSARRFTFSCINLPPDAFEVVRFEGEEALSTLYHFDILLACKDSEIDTTALVGHEAKNHGRRTTNG
jgi:uncharacterized protein involved in type VI secretion and phage assembly